MPTVIFKPIHWSEKEVEKSASSGLTTRIIISGETEDGKTVYVQVDDYRPWMIVEFPPGVHPSKKSRISFIKQFCSSYETQKNPTNVDDPNLKFEKMKVIQLSREILALRLRIACKSYAKEFANTLMYRDHNWNGKHYPKGSFHVHEFNIEGDLKFCTERDLETADWLEVKYDKNLSYATGEYQLKVNMDDVTNHKSDTIKTIHAKYCCFDIECTSKNPNSKLPDPDEVENEVFQIAMIFGQVGIKNSRKVFLLTQFDPQDIENVTVLRKPNEKELILEFSKLIQKYNPSVFFSYNGIKFDWHYLIRRAEQLKIWHQFTNIGRVPGEFATKKETAWQSSAYGEEKFNYLDIAGRTDIDVQIEIRRTKRLDSYSLNAVAEEFLKAAKDDISPRELFMSFDVTRKWLSKLQPSEGKSDTLQKSELKSMRKFISRKMVRRKCSGRVREIRDKLLNSRTPITRSRALELVRELIHLTGKYCVKDTLLTIDLAEHLNIYTSMEQMACALNVPMSYLHTRGTQIKVLAKALRYTYKEGFVVPHLSSKDKKTVERYEGAIVFDAVPGLYDNVILDDFEALYPTRMRDDNICPTKYHPNDDGFPDEKCCIIEGESHLGCVHDKKKNRPKKRKDGAVLPIICGPFRYRFEKPKFNADGTVENLGLFPRIARDLMTNRKKVKAEMPKVMDKILKSRDEKEKFNLKAMYDSLGSKEQALKIAVNSAYGGLASEWSKLSLVAAAASVTARGRELIVEAVRYITKVIAKRDNVTLEMVYGDTDSCMISYKNMSAKEAYDRGRRYVGETTHHLKMWRVRDEKYPEGLPDDYRLSKKDGTKVDVQSAVKLVASGELKRTDLVEEDAVRLCHYEYLSVNLQMESIYITMLLLSQKLYISQPGNSEGLPFKPDGSLIPRSKKGVLSVKRVNSKFSRETYDVVTSAVMDRKHLDDILQSFVDRCKMMFTRPVFEGTKGEEVKLKIPDSHFIAYTAVKTILKYAKTNDKGEYIDAKKKRFKPQTISKGIDVTIDEDGNETHTEKTEIDPLDPRLVYSVPQATLAVHMIQRGDDVPANTRLEYVITDVPSKKMGDKWEDYTYYRENRAIGFRDGIRIDKLMYIKKLSEPIQKVVDCVSPGEPTLRMKYEDELRWAISSCPPSFQAVLKNVKTFARVLEKSVTLREDRSKWGVWNSSGDFKKRKWSFGKDRVHPLVAENRDEVRYMFKKQQHSQARFILESVRKRSLRGPGWRNELDPDTEWGKRLVKAARRFVSNAVLLSRIRSVDGKKETNQAAIMRNRYALLCDVGDFKEGSLWKKKPGSKIEIRNQKLKTAKPDEKFITLVSNEDQEKELVTSQDKLCSWELKNERVVAHVYKVFVRYQALVKEFNELVREIEVRE